MRLIWLVSTADYNRWRSEGDLDLLVGVKFCDGSLACGAGRCSLRRVAQQVLDLSVQRGDVAKTKWPVRESSMISGMPAVG